MSNFIYDKAAGALWGGNDGTLINFPTDDSQWVFYGEPSAGINLDLLLTTSEAAVFNALVAPGQTLSPGLTLASNAVFSPQISGSKKVSCPNNKHR